MFVFILVVWDVVNVCKLPIYVVWPDTTPVNNPRSVFNCVIGSLNARIYHNPSFRTYDNPSIGESDILVNISYYNVVILLEFVFILVVWDDNVLFIVVIIGASLSLTHKPTFLK